MVRILPLSFAALAACAAVSAQAPGSLPALIARAAPAQPVAQEFRQLRLEGREVHRAVREVVTSLRWHARLPDALRDAGAAGGRPVVWIQALGDLKGFT